MATAQCPPVALEGVCGPCRQCQVQELRISPLPIYHGCSGYDIFGEKLERVSISVLAMRLCYRQDLVRFRCRSNCSSQSHTNTKTSYTALAFRIDDPVC